MTLTQLQQCFKKAMEADARPWTPAELGLRDHPPVAFATRVDIYHYAFAARIADSLAEDFPYVQAWIGEDSFTRRVRPFLRRYPSCYRGIAEISRHFPGYLAEAPEPRDPVFLPQLAAFEWAQTAALATDRRATPDVISLLKLPNLPIEKTCLVLNPSLILLQSGWPVDKLRKPRAMAPLPQEVRLAIYRGTSGLRSDRLRPAQWNFLHKVHSGLQLSRLLEWLMQSHVNPAILQQWFTTWSARGLLQGLRRHI